MDAEPMAGRDVVDAVTVFGTIAQCGVVPVAVIDDEADALPLGEALLAAGLPCIEVTFRTDAAAESIRTLTEAFPEMLVGAGTVLTVDQAEAAGASGSQFVVSPVTDGDVVGWCLDHGISVIPGASTPNEVHTAMSMGADVVKLFPAELAGGVAAVRAMSSVFPDVRFVPTGGVGVDDLGRYLSVPSVLACGGTWIADRRSIADGEWPGIRRRAAAAVEVVRNVRNTS